MTNNEIDRAEDSEGEKAASDAAFARYMSLILKDGLAPEDHSSELLAARGIKETLRSTVRDPLDGHQPDIFRTWFLAHVSTTHSMADQQHSRFLLPDMYNAMLQSADALGHKLETWQGIFSAGDEADRKYLLVDFLSLKVELECDGEFDLHGQLVSIPIPDKVEASDLGCALRDWRFVYLLGLCRLGGKDEGFDDFIQSEFFDLVEKFDLVETAKQVAQDMMTVWSPDTTDFVTALFNEEARAKGQGKRFIMNFDMAAAIEQELRLLGAGAPRDGHIAYRFVTYGPGQESGVWTTARVPVEASTAEVVMALEVAYAQSPGAAPVPLFHRDNYSTIYRDGFEIGLEEEWALTASKLPLTLH